MNIVLNTFRTSFSVILNPRRTHTHLSTFNQTNKPKKRKISLKMSETSSDASQVQQRNTQQQNYTAKCGCLLQSTMNVLESFLMLSSVC